MDVKTCKQCGELKPISQFRKYYGGRKGTYKMCKGCERVNSREKYLAGKVDLSDAEREELSKIHTLYEMQRNAGLQPPTKSGRRQALTESLDDMIQKYAQMSAEADKAAGGIPLQFRDAPRELIKWITEPLTREPDYYMDEVYEKLVDTYRPCVGIDRETMMPVYDNKYKGILDCILDRFTEYEDSYYEGAE